MKTYFSFNVATNDGKALPHTYLLDNPVSFVEATETLYMNDCYITEIGVEPFDDEKYDFVLCYDEVMFTDSVFNDDLAAATAPIEHRIIEKKHPLFEMDEEATPAPAAMPPAAPTPTPTPAPAPSAPTRASVYRPTEEEMNNWYNLLQGILATPVTGRRCF